MPATFEITYLRDGRTEETWLTRGLYYELENGQNLDVNTHIAWCSECKLFTDGELIQTPDEICNQIAELRDPSSAARKFADWNAEQIRIATGRAARNYNADRITTLETRLKWSILRKSPPKCILCGKTDITFPLTMHETEAELDIPEIGRVRIECAGISSTEFMNWFFTPEGDRVTRDTKPTYWGIPDNAT